MNVSEQYVKIGHKFYDDQEYEKALICAERCLLLNPYFFSAYELKTISLEDLDRQEEADECMNTAIVKMKTSFSYS